MARPDYPGSGLAKINLNEPPLPQELQGRLRHDVTLCQDRRTRGQENLITGELDGFPGDIGVADGAFGRRRVLLLYCKGVDGEFEAVLLCAKLGAQGVDTA